MKDYQVRVNCTETTTRDVIVNVDPMEFLDQLITSVVQLPRDTIIDDKGNYVIPNKDISQRLIINNYITLNVKLSEEEITVFKDILKLKDSLNKLLNGPLAQ